MFNKASDPSPGTSFHKTENQCSLQNDDGIKTSLGIIWQITQSSLQVFQLEE